MLRVTLTTITTPDRPQELWLQSGQTFTIGRSEASDRPFTLDLYMSSIHARLSCTEDECRVEDLGSTNGTFLNQRRIETGSLQAGDQLRIGHTVFSVALLQDDSQHEIRQSPTATGETLREAPLPPELEDLRPPQRTDSNVPRMPAEPRDSRDVRSPQPEPVLKPSLFSRPSNWIAPTITGTGQEGVAILRADRLDSRPLDRLIEPLQKTGCWYWIIDDARLDEWPDVEAVPLFDWLPRREARYQSPYLLPWTRPAQGRQAWLEKRWNEGAISAIALRQGPQSIDAFRGFLLGKSRLNGVPDPAQMLIPWSLERLAKRLCGDEPGRLSLLRQAASSCILPARVEGGDAEASGPHAWSLFLLDADPTGPLAKVIRDQLSCELPADDTKKPSAE